MSANFPAIVEVVTADGVRYEARFFPAFKAPPAIAEQHFALERRRVVQTVQQMKLDSDSYNDNNEFGVTMEPQDYNIQRDLDEMELSAEYDPNPYGDEDEED